MSAPKITIATTAAERAAWHRGELPPPKIDTPPPTSTLAPMQPVERAVWPEHRRDSMQRDGVGMPVVSGPYCSHPRFADIPHWEVRCQTCGAVYARELDACPATLAHTTAEKLDRVMGDAIDGLKL